MVPLTSTSKNELEGTDSIATSFPNVAVRIPSSINTSWDSSQKKDPPSKSVKSLNVTWSVPSLIALPFGCVKSP